MVHSKTTIALDIGGHLDGSLMAALKTPISWSVNLCCELYALDFPLSTHSPRRSVRSPFDFRRNCACNAISRRSDDVSTDSAKTCTQMCRLRPLSAASCFSWSSNWKGGRPGTRGTTSSKRLAERSLQSLTLRTYARCYTYDPQSFEGA